MTTMSIKLATAAAIAVGGAGLFAGPASAAPMIDPAVAHATDLAGAKAENVRWVCGPYRCWWRPGPRFYGGYGPRFYGGGPRFYGGGPRFYGGYGGWRGRGWGGGWHGRRW